VYILRAGREGKAKDMVAYIYIYICMLQMNFGVCSHVTAVICVRNSEFALIIQVSYVKTQLTCVTHMHLVAPVKAAEN